MSGGVAFFDSEEELGLIERPDDDGGEGGAALVNLEQVMGPFCPTDSYQVVKGKKKILRTQLRSSAWPRDEKKLVLQRAIVAGSYSIITELLPSFSEADFLLIRSELEQEAFRAKRYLTQAFINSYLEQPIFNSQAIYATLEARQQAINDGMMQEAILEACLKEIKEYDVAQDYIRQIIQKQRQDKRANNSIISVFRAACPSLTFATIIGAVSFVSPLAWMATVVTLGLFVITWPLVSLAMYHRLSQAYGPLAQEKLYRTWAAARFSELYQQKKQLNRQWRELRGIELDDEDDSGDSEQRRAALYAEYERLNQLQSELFQHTLLQREGKSAKLKLFSLPAADFSSIKERAAFDNNDPAQWASYRDRLSSLISCAVELFCALGALSVVVFSLGGIVTQTVGWGFLGTGAAAFLMSPAGLYAASAIVTIALLLVLGYFIYKIAYQQANKEAGERNKSFIIEHRACKTSLKALEQEDQEWQRLQQRDDRVVSLPGRARRASDSDFFQLQAVRGPASSTSSPPLRHTR